MSIRSAIDALTGKNSKNIEEAIRNVELGGGGSENFIINMHFPTHPGDEYTFDKTYEELSDIPMDSIFFYEDSFDILYKPVSITGHVDGTNAIHFYLIRDLSVPKPGVSIYAIAYVILTCLPNGTWTVESGGITQPAE